MVESVWSLEVEVVEASDLPPVASQGCFCCITILNDTAGPTFLAQMSHNIGMPRGATSAHIFVPQMTTEPSRDPINPVWGQAFFAVDAVQLDLYQETEVRNMVRFHGQPLMLLVTIHDTASSGTCIGKVVITDVRPGPEIDQWYFVATDDRKQAMGADGQPSALHVRVDYSCLPQSPVAEQAPPSEPPAQSHPSLWSRDMKAPSSAKTSTHVSSHGPSPMYISSPETQTVPQAPYSQLLPTQAHGYPQAHAQFAPAPPRNSRKGPRTVANPRQTRLPPPSSFAEKEALLAFTPAMYQTEERHVVEGYKSVMGYDELDIGARHTSKPVHVRCCAGGEDEGWGMTINIEGATELLMVEFCKNVRVVIGRVTGEIIAVGCQGLELVVGGSMPSTRLIACDKCMLLTGKDAWNTSVYSVGCKDISVHAAHSQGLTSMEARDLVQAKVVERVLLPDTLLTQMAAGSISTICHFSAQPTPGALRAKNLAASGSRSQAAPEDDQREVSDVPETREYVSPGHIADGAFGPHMGVGITLKKSDHGLRVAELAPGGPAAIDGRIQVGDVLMAIDERQTKGRRLLDVGEDLSGPPMSTVKLSLGRFSVLGNNMVDVALRRVNASTQAHPQSAPAQPFPPPTHMPSLPRAQQLRPPKTLSDSMAHNHYGHADPSAVSNHSAHASSSRHGGIGLVANSPPSLRETYPRPSPPRPSPPRSEAGVVLTLRERLAGSQGPMAPGSLKGSSRGAPQALCGVGLGVRPTQDGSYKVSGLVPGGPAEQCGQIHAGDVLHSVDGVTVCGKTYDDVRDMVRGVPGSRVMIAFLRSEAKPEHLLMSMEEFDHWRPVVLTRTPAHGGSGASTPAFGASPALSYAPPPRSVPDMPKLPMQTNSVPDVPSNRPMQEAVAMALWLDEDFDVLVYDERSKASLCSHLAHDMADALQANPKRIAVMDLLKGSVVADVVIAPDEHDKRSPQRLAAEIAKMVADSGSRLRLARSTSRAVRAEVRGPVAEVRPLRDVLHLYNKEDTPKLPRDSPSSLPKGGTPVPMEGSGEEVGVGVTLLKDDIGLYEILEVTPGGSADRSGEVYVGNTLFAVNGVQVTGKPEDFVHNILTGPPGSQVTLGLVRQPGSKGGLDAAPLTVHIPLTRRFSPGTRIRTAAEEMGMTAKYGSSPGRMTSPATSVMNDSRNSSRPGTRDDLNLSPSERQVAQNFSKLFGSTPGRIVSPPPKDEIIKRYPQDEVIRKEEEARARAELERELNQKKSEEERKRLLEQKLKQQQAEIARKEEEMRLRREMEQEEERIRLLKQKQLEEDKHRASRVLQDAEYDKEKEKERIKAELMARIEGQERKEREKKRQQETEARIRAAEEAHQEFAKGDSELTRMRDEANLAAKARRMSQLSSLTEKAKEVQDEEALARAEKRRKEEEAEREWLRKEEERRLQLQQKLTDPGRLYSSQSSSIGRDKPAPVPSRGGHVHSGNVHDSGPMQRRTVVLTRAPAKHIQPVSGQNYGVGVSFQVSKLTGCMVVVSLSEGGQAAASGQIQVGDIIHSVNNAPVKGKRVPEVVALMKGPLGTTVVFEVEDGNSQHPVTGAHGGGLYSSHGGVPGGGSGHVSLYSSLDSQRSQSLAAGLPQAPPRRNSTSLYGSRSGSVAGDNPFTRVAGELPFYSTQTLSVNGDAAPARGGGSLYGSQTRSVSGAGAKEGPGGAKSVVRLPRKPRPGQVAAYGESVGVGIGFNKLATGNFEICELYPGSSADLSGQVRVGDKLLQIDGKPINDYGVSEVVHLLRGPENSIVSITLELGPAHTQKAAHSTAGSPSHGENAYPSNNGAPPANASSARSASEKTAAYNSSASPIFIPGVQTHVNDFKYPPPNPVVPILQEHLVPMHDSLALGGNGETVLPSKQHPSAVKIETGGSAPSGAKPRGSDSSKFVPGFSITPVYPFLITEVDRLMDEKQSLQGNPGYSNDYVTAGDTLVSVANTSVQGFNGEDLLKLLVGSYLTPLDIQISKTSKGLDHVHKLRVLRQIPYEKDVLFGRDSVLASSSPHSSAFPSPQKQPSSSNASHELHVWIKHATGLAEDAKGRLPVTICKLRLLLPNTDYVDMGLAPSSSPSADPDFGSHHSSATMSASQLNSSQLEVTLWDSVNGRDGFMGEIVVNVNKLEQIIGQYVQHTFVVKAGSTFVPQREAKGILLMGLRLDSL